MRTLALMTAMVVLPVSSALAQTAPTMTYVYVPVAQPAAVAAPAPEAPAPKPRQTTLWDLDN